MIFDLILVIMIIIALTRASAKGCTEDLHFAIAFLVIIRLSGILYRPASMIFSKFISSESISFYAGYLLVAIILLFSFNALVGQRIIELGKKIPKTTALVFTYFFAVIKTMMIFSLIFGLVYTFPILKRAPEKYVTPRSYGLTQAFLGNGTGELFHNLAAYMTEKLRTPVDFMARQKAKQVQGTKTGLDAVQSHEGLKNFITVKPDTKKPDEKKTEDTKTEEK